MSMVDGRNGSEGLVPRQARPVDLKKSQPADAAAAIVLRECTGQIAANIPLVIASVDPEGPHQLRIGLRRLRSALSAFSAVLGGQETKRLSAEARWLGQEVGLLRDLDVIRTGIVPAAMARNPQDARFEALASALGEAALAARERLSATLQGERVSTFLADLDAFVCRLDGTGLDAPERPAGTPLSVADLAVTALDRRWKKSVRAAGRIGKLTLAERHVLRKELKKLRYCAEFLLPLFPRRKAKPFLKRLKQLQDVFGLLNDARMVAGRLDEVLSDGRAPDGARHAAGWIAGYAACEADVAWTHARALWKDLGKTRRFWTSG